MKDMGRNHFVDVLKGVCIFFVIITHYAWIDGERLRYLFPFWIDMAVPVFMIISGFVYSNSYIKHGITSIGEAYLLKNTLNKICRYTIPFAFAFVIEEMARITLKNPNENAIQIVFNFFNGGIGPGGYYFPLMIQFIYTFPIIYFIVKSYDFNGLAICAFINAIYELLQRAYGMNEECYRLLLFRYILVIAVGCYLAVGRRKIDKKLYVISEIIGISFILACCYFDYTPQIIIYWTRTSFLACLYIIPIIIVLLKKVTWRCKPLEILGKASYDIFLAQKIYFNGAAYMYSIVPNRILQFLINIAICVVAGVLFYYIELPITKFLSRKFCDCLEKSVSCTDFDS